MYTRFVGLILRLQHSEGGQAYVEYVVLSALAVLVILGSIQYFFGAISALFTRLGETLGVF